jgi:hypothetical protein
MAPTVWSYKKQEADMARLTSENRNLRTTVQTLTTEHRNHRGSHGDDIGTDRRRSGGGKGGVMKTPSAREPASPQEKDFIMEKLNVCREWNT